MHDQPGTGGIPGAEGAPEMAPWESLRPAQVSQAEVSDLIRRADEHALGRAFLMEGAQGANREGFRRYFEDVRRIGTPDPSLLYWKLRVEPRDLDRAWRRFIASAATGG